MFASSSRLFAIPGVDSHLTGVNYIREGCDAGRLVRDVLYLLVEQKLNILLRRMEYTMSKLSADLTKVMCSAYFSSLTLLFCINFLAFLF